MSNAAYLYPWDIVGDPAAPDLVAGLGLDHVTLAAVYHAVRALTPRHPSHRLVVAPRTAAYFPPPGALPGPLRLEPAGWLGSADPFGTAASALREAGLPVYAWVVLAHVDLPEPTPFSVVNAYGDGYPWALCPAWDEVVTYATGVAAEVSALDGLAGVELEACGWYGWEHQCLHDKVPIGLSAAETYLLSLCFCTACEAGYRSIGLDHGRLRLIVQNGLDAALRGKAAAPGRDTGGLLGEIGALLGDYARPVADLRHRVADRLRREVIGLIRAKRPEWTIGLHASPQPAHAAAFTGVDMAASFTAASFPAASFVSDGPADRPLVDELIVNCWGGHDAVAPSLAAGVPVHASLLAVAGMTPGSDPLDARAERARAAGATGLRLYHAGLAADRDLDAIRALLALPEGIRARSER